MPLESKLTATANFLTKIAGVTSTITGRGGRYVQAAGMLGGIASDFNKRQQNADILKAERDLASKQVDNELLKTSRGYAGVIHNNTANHAFLGIHDYIQKGEMDNLTPEQVRDKIGEAYNDIVSKTTDRQALNIYTRHFHDKQLKLLDMHAKRHNEWVHKQIITEGDRAVTQELQMIKRGLLPPIENLQQFTNLLSNVPEHEREGILLNAAQAAIMDGNGSGIDLLEVMKPSANVLIARREGRITFNKILADQNAALIATEVDKIVTATENGSLTMPMFQSMEAQYPYMRNVYSTKDKVKLIHKATGIRHQNNMRTALTTSIINGTDLYMDISTLKPAERKNAFMLAFDSIIQNTNDPLKVAGAFGSILEKYPDDASPHLKKYFSALGQTGEFDARYKAGEQPPARIEALRSAMQMSNYLHTANAEKAFGQYTHMVKFCAEFLGGNDGASEADALNAWDIYKKDPVEVTKEFVKERNAYIKDEIDKFVDVSWREDALVTQANLNMMIRKEAAILERTERGITPESVAALARERVMNRFENIDGTLYPRKGGVTMQKRFETAGMPDTRRINDEIEYFKENVKIFHNELGEAIPAKDLRIIVMGEELALQDDQLRTVQISNEDFVKITNVLHEKERQEANLKSGKANALTLRAEEQVLDMQRDMVTNIFNKLEVGSIADLSRRELDMYQDMQDAVRKNKLADELSEEVWDSLEPDDQRLLLIDASTVAGFKTLTMIEKLKNGVKDWFSREATEKQKNSNLAYSRLARIGGVAEPIVSPKAQELFEFRPTPGFLPEEHPAAKQFPEVPEEEEIIEERKL